jgi:hypothetical protein
VASRQAAESDRSIQGVFIRGEAQAAIDQSSRIRLETLARISPLARYFLDLRTER